MVDHIGTAVHGPAFSMPFLEFVEFYFNGEVNRAGLEGDHEAAKCQSVH